MHLFISAGEPSGDIHGANLIRAIQAQNPGVCVTGFGGDRMSAAGAMLLFPLTKLAVMWFGRVLANIVTFIRLARQAEEHFRTERPDAVILIDYPGFNFALAKRAHDAGIPVYFFVPPQLWAWAGWRVKKVRRWFTGVLTALPFEEKWYRDRGVNTVYVGHPFFDELPTQQFDVGFVSEQRAMAGRIVAVLPGSRTQEVIRNFPEMVAAMTKIAVARPDVRFLVASFNEQQAQVARELLGTANLPIEFHVGRTPEIIELAECCLSVSGSVSLELMARLKPTVIVYKVGRIFNFLARKVFMTVQHVTLVNLLAENEVFPEYATFRPSSTPIANHIVHWLSDPTARETCVQQLRTLRDRVARPGTCDRAAAFLLATLQTPSNTTQAA